MNAEKDCAWLKTACPFKGSDSIPVKVHSEIRGNKLVIEKWEEPENE